MTFITNEKEHSKMIKWIIGEDTGASSIALWAVAFDSSKDYEPRIPWDCWDFGRCYRLLKLLRENNRGELLTKAANEYPMWKPYVAKWGELSELYKRHAYSKLNAALDKIEESA